MRPQTIETIPHPPTMWVVSKAGYALLRKFEALSLTAYDDGYGNWAIGYGHTVEDRSPKVITEDQAEALLKLDALKALHTLRSTLTVSLYWCEVDALVSLIFNIGDQAWRDSTLRLAIEAKDGRNVKQDWMMWKYSNGRISRGLIARRKAELKLFCEVPF